jgi:hypothetical protein
LRVERLVESWDKQLVHWMAAVKADEWEKLLVEMRVYWLANYWVELKVVC